MKMYNIKNLAECELKMIGLTSSYECLKKISPTNIPNRVKKLS